MSKKVFELFVERDNIKLTLDFTEQDVANVIATAYEEQILSLLKEVCACNETVAIKLLAWLKE